MEIAARNRQYKQIHCPDYIGAIAIVRVKQMENKSTHEYQMELLARSNKQLITAQLSYSDYDLLALIASDRDVPLVQLASEFLMKGICE